MPARHDFQCTACDRQFDEIITRIDLCVDGVVPPEACPPCPTCGAQTERIWLPPTVTWSADAVVVYEAPDGSFRYPGMNDGTSTAKYDRMGYRRIEARGFAEVRQLEARMNRHERAQLSRANERRLEHIEQVEGQRRSATRDGINQGFYIPEARLEMVNGREQVVHTGRRQFVRLSERTKDQLRATMARNDAKGHRTVRDTGVHVDVYSNDRGSRDESRRSDGKRFRD